MSIEPLWFDVAPVFERWLREEGDLPFEWAIIGAASNGSRVYPAKGRDGQARLLDTLDQAGVQVFFKGNLDRGRAWREGYPAA